MLELQGKFGTAKVFTDVVDNESISGYQSFESTVHRGKQSPYDARHSCWGWLYNRNHDDHQG